MTHETFWQIIESAKAASMDGEQQVTLIRQRLLDLSPEDILTFSDLLNAYALRPHIDSVAHNHIQEGSLWDTVSSLVGFCSDDSFQYFVWWLIAQGQQTYQTVINHPAAIAEFIDKDNWRLEQLGYVASEAYEQKTGNSFDDVPNMKYVDVRTFRSKGQPA